MNTWVTPNHLTTARLVTGLAAGAAWGIAWIGLGASLFAVSMLMDRADGELARQQGASSAFGHRYDLVTDAAVNVGVMIGIGFGLTDGSLGQWAVFAGLVAGAAIGYILWLMVQVEKARGQGAAKLGAFAGFDPDDAMILIPIGMLLGWGEFLIVAAAIGAPAAALILRRYLGRAR